MRIYLFFTLFVLLFGCSTSVKNEIIVPKLHAGFYAEALEKIDRELGAVPSNEILIEQKLYYCDQLGWPTTCLTALDAYRTQNGMTERLLMHYLAYYERHGHYTLALDVMDRWLTEFELDTKSQKILITSLVKTKKTARAKAGLRSYLVDHQTLADLTFAIGHYLTLSDTLMAVYNLSKLVKLDPKSDLMGVYGNLLVSLGFFDKGFNALESYYAFNKRQDVAWSLALLYEQEERISDARQALKPFATKDDNVAFQLSDWYKRELIWDSAVMYLDSVIYRDSLNADAWWRKGKAFEERGWNSYSLQFYEKLLEIDPKDTMAANQIDRIRRKIAYLHRQRTEQRKVPFLELEPIKIEN